MRIIGCDLHARQQTLAMLDTTTGEVVNLTLTHEGNQVREFYSSSPAARAGRHRGRGIDALVSELDGGVGNRVPSRPSRADSCGGTSQTETRPPRRGVDFKAAGRKPLSGHLPAQQGAARSARSAPAPSSVGAHAHPHTKRVAGDCLGQWSTARSQSLEPAGGDTEGVSSQFLRGAVIAGIVDFPRDFKGSSHAFTWIRNIDRGKVIRARPNLSQHTFALRTGDGLLCPRTRRPLVCLHRLIDSYLWIRKLYAK